MRYNLPKFKFLILFIFTLFIVAPCVLAQGTSQDRKNEAEAEKARAEAEKIRAEARKAEIDAANAAFSASFPAPSSKPLEGTTTINDNVVIEPQTVSYISMAELANRIVATIKENDTLKSSTSLSIYNEKDVSLLLTYQVARKQIELMQGAYCDLITNSDCPKKSSDNASAAFTSAAPLKIAQSFLGGFVDLTAFLRTNVEIKGQTFDIDESALVAEVFRAAQTDKGLGKNLYYPKTFPPFLGNIDSEILGLLEKVNMLKNLSQNIEDKNSEITEKEKSIKSTEEELLAASKKEKEEIEKASRLMEVYAPDIYKETIDISAKFNKIASSTYSMPLKEKEMILALRDNIKIIQDLKTSLTSKKLKLEGELSSLKKEFESLAGDLAKPNQEEKLKMAITQLKNLNKQFDNYVTSFTQIDSTTKTNLLTSCIKAEHLSAALTPNHCWLELKVLKAGGNNRIKTNLIVDIFTGGNRLSHSGGVIVLYNLFDNTGKVLLSDTLTNYKGYINARKVKNLAKDFKNLDHPTLQ